MGGLDNLRDFTMRGNKSARKGAPAGAPLAPLRVYCNRTTMEVVRRAVPYMVKDGGAPVHGGPVAELEFVLFENGKAFDVSFDPAPPPPVAGAGSVVGAGAGAGTGAVAGPSDSAAGSDSAPDVPNGGGGALRVTPFALEHGGCTFSAFRIGGLAWCSDCSRVPEDARPHLEGASHVVLDYLRGEPHPTHFGWEQVGGSGCGGAGAGVRRQEAGGSQESLE